MSNKEMLKKILNELNEENEREDALHTYYNNYEVEDLIQIIYDVVVKKEGYEVGDYAV